MDFLKLIRHIACAICQSTQKPKPKIELLWTPTPEVRQEISALGLKLLYPTLMDENEPYYYTKAEDWARVFSYIYFDFAMPSYLVARMDCEDFAILLKGLVSALFGLNYFGFVLGWMPRGYHGWDMFKTENGMIQLEPQSGEFFPLDERGYKPEYILI